MSFLEELNTVQREAVTTVEGPILIVAGAGSGKTRVLTYRVAHLLKMGVPAYQILALTFTNKAAAEMKSRIKRLMPAMSTNLWMGTFHSIFARFLRMHPERVGLKSNFSIYDTVDSHNVVKRIMTSLGISSQAFSPSAIRSKISFAKNKLTDDNVLQAEARTELDRATAQVFVAYKRLLHESNAVDFDDLLIKPIELLNSSKILLQQYQDRFRFILVDEYQDTNHAQYTLLQLIASRYKNICVVGDDAQSIYAFRGADIQNILRFQQDYPHAKIFYLEQNYRSTKAILTAADRVIKRNTRQLAKNLWTQNEDGEHITVLSCHDDKDEGNQIAISIANHTYKEKRDFKDYAVLYRTNAQSRSLEDALRRKNIPYVIVGGTEFYQRKEIKDVLAYFKLYCNPLDDDSFLRTVNVPSRGVGDSTIEQLKNHAAARKCSLFDASRDVEMMQSIGGRAKKGIQEFMRVFEKYHAIESELSVSELCRAMVDEIGILTLFKEEATSESIARWENVQELLSAISEFAAEREQASLQQFLEEVSLVSDIDRWNDSQNVVTLMTLHSAKGIEFPVVFIAGLEEGLLPLYTNAVEQEELEEERRLFYVGITRAMKKLFLTHAGLRYRYGEMNTMVPSRFLHDLGEEDVAEMSSNGIRESVKTADNHRQRTKRHTTILRLSYQKESTDTMPNYELYNDEVQVLHIGTMVEHEQFGKGKIVSLYGSGSSLKVSVDFESVGRKNLMAMFAHLKIL